MPHTTISNRAWIRQLAILAIIPFITTQSGCTAAAFAKPSLAIEVQSAVSSGSVNVRLSNDTAILTGRVDSSYDSLAAERAAANYEGVKQVVNRIYVIRLR